MIMYICILESQKRRTVSNAINQYSFNFFQVPFSRLIQLSTKIIFTFKPDYL